VKVSDESGFLFFTPEMKAWLGGYEPVIAAEFCAPKPGMALVNAAEKSKAKHEARQRAQVARGEARKEPV
jgi:hypothetical protein